MSLDTISMPKMIIMKCIWTFHNNTIFSPFYTGYFSTHFMPEFLCSPSETFAGAPWAALETSTSTIPHDFGWSYPEYSPTALWTPYANIAGLHSHGTNELRNTSSAGQRAGILKLEISTVSVCASPIVLYFCVLCFANALSRQGGWREHECSQLRATMHSNETDWQWCGLPSWWGWPCKATQVSFIQLVSFFAGACNLIYLFIWRLNSTSLWVKSSSFWDGASLK